MEAAKSLLYWSPSMSLAEGLRQTIGSFAISRDACKPSVYNVLGADVFDTAVSSRVEPFTY
jgi:hypothetical protein